MPRYNIKDFTIGHNEETFQFFTDLAKRHKALVLEQDKLMKDVSSIEKLDITETLDIIRKAEQNLKEKELKDKQNE
jgi:hypothetical protein